MPSSKADVAMSMMNRCVIFENLTLLPPQAVEPLQASQPHRTRSVVPDSDHTLPVSDLSNAGHRRCVQVLLSAKERDHRRQARRCGSTEFGAAQRYIRARAGRG